MRKNNRIIPGQQSYSELTAISEQRLKLIIELKQKEIELAKLFSNDSINDSKSEKVLVKLRRKNTRDTVSTMSKRSTASKKSSKTGSSLKSVYPSNSSLRDSSSTNSIKTTLSSMSKKVPLRNFGEENCEIFNELKPKVDVKFLAKELLTKLHFNNKYPENRNLFYNNLSSDNISVYVDNKWQSVSIDTLIDEYLKGNLERLRYKTPLYGKIRYLVNNSISKLHEECKATLIQQTRKANKKVSKVKN